MPALQPPNLLLIKIETAIIKTTKRKGAMFMLKITYIEHSGFLLETENAVFLFDYYKGALPQINPQKPLFVFVSHKHGDHYNPDIFSFRRIVLAPGIAFAGFVFMIYAIMKKSK